MLKIESVNIPIVGEIYNVPCIGGRPITGEPHVDTEFFNQTVCHYHRDTRFSNDKATTASFQYGIQTREELVCLRNTPVDWGIEELTQIPPRRWWRWFWIWQSTIHHEQVTPIWMKSMLVVNFEFWRCRFLLSYPLRCKRRRGALSRHGCDHCSRHDRDRYDYRS